MNNILKVSPSPHVYEHHSVPKLMYGVVIALLPALGASVYYFGMGAIVVTLVAIISSVLFEYLIQKFILKQQPKISDGSAALTGLLLAFNVPSNLPIWMIIVGSLVAIGIGKMSFGGLGNNPFNPALVGRVFLLISFPVEMTNWPVQGKLNFSLSGAYTDAVSGATPLGALKSELSKGQNTVQEILANGVPLEGGEVYHFPTYMEQLMGNMGGSMGEVSAILLLAGLVYMLIRKIITWHIPVVTLGTVFIFSGILHWINPGLYVAPEFHILTGGVLLGAIFMATDYVTSPMTSKGMIIYSVGIGVITVIIRVFGAYPEGISFAILIMNAFVPLINTYVKPKRFGEVVKNG